MSSKSMVASPCISVCTVDEDTGYCRGCFRTLEEIAQWDRYDDVTKLAVWDKLEARRDENEKESGPY